jgi:UDP-N-acetylmuramoylalanine-D-glutamate ligase
MIPIHGYAGRKVAVPGIGRSGLATARALLAGGAGAPLTPDEGADTPIWLALLPDVGPTGGFFRRRQAIAW